MGKQTQFNTLYDVVEPTRRHTVNVMGQGPTEAIRLGYASDKHPCSIILVDNPWYLVSGYTDHNAVDLANTVDQSKGHNLLDVMACWFQY